MWCNKIEKHAKIDFRKIAQTRPPKSATFQTFESRAVKLPSYDLVLRRLRVHGKCSQLQKQFWIWDYLPWRNIPLKEDTKNQEKGIKCIRFSSLFKQS